MSWRLWEWDSVAIATNKRNPALPMEGNPGDSLPVTMANIRDWLTIPRQYVKFSIGGVTVLESPGPDLANP